MLTLVLRLQSCLSSCHHFFHSTLTTLQPQDLAPFSQLIDGSIANQLKPTRRFSTCQSLESWLNQSQAKANTRARLQPLAKLQSPFSASAPSLPLLRLQSHWPDCKPSSSQIVILFLPFFNTSPSWKHLLLYHRICCLILFLPTVPLHICEPLKTLSIVVTLNRSWVFCNELCSGQLTHSLLWVKSNDKKRTEGTL